MVVFETHTYGCSHSSIDDRNLPVLFVIKLAGSDEYRRSGEHGSNLEGAVVMGNAMEELLK